MKYLSEDLIRKSFLRLKQKKSGGKKGVERTSALMCFLAFDALMKRTGISPPLNLDPEDSHGKNNRDVLTREFVRLVLVKTIETSACHVIDLGKIELGGNPPDKRFSSNFLTVSLKKATKTGECYDYPSRPRNPLMVLGPAATGLTWGMDRHPDWKENLPVFLQERKTKTPFHDLACFVLRQRIIDEEAEDLSQALVSGLSELFTQELAEFWARKLALEKVYLEKTDSPFQESLPHPFDDHSWLGDTEQADRVLALNSRINYLEGLLRLHHIAFDD